MSQEKDKALQAAIDLMVQEDFATATLVPKLRAALASPAAPVLAATADDNLGAKLHDTMDAQVWATEFCRLNNSADHGMMLAWFANAIMVGWDHAKRAAAPVPPVPAPTDRNAVLEEAVQACMSKWAERTSGDLNERQLAHNTAVSQCCDAIRALKSGTPEGATQDA